MIQAFNKSGKSLTDKFLISWALMKILDQIYFIFNSHFKIYYYNNRQNMSYSYNITRGSQRVESRGQKNWVKSNYDDDIKQSNISQQTIIHKAKLYSPEKNYEQLEREPNQRTKTKRELENRIHQVADLVHKDRQESVNHF